MGEVGTSDGIRVRNQIVESKRQKNARLKKGVIKAREANEYGEGVQEQRRSKSHARGASKAMKEA
jgi:hypothetical protein